MKSLIETKRLSHLALNVLDVDAQAHFYTEMVGLGETVRDAQGRVYLRCGAEHHTIVLQPAAERDMDHFALDLGSQAAVAAAAGALDRVGIAYETVEGVELGQGTAVRIQDPDGFVVELVAGLKQVSPNYGGRAVQPRRFGHLTLRVTDLQQSSQFYQEILGFRISDWLGEQFCWLRCTPEHHGIAMSTHARAPMMHHLAFHVRDMAELIQQAEFLMKNGRILLYGPGRHGPGQNLFIYFHDAEENIVEFAADMQRIWDEENYVPKVWNPDERWSNMWGPPALPAFRE